MELLLIRHALPIRRELEGGIADPELSRAGLAQANYLAEYLATEHLDAIYSSPLTRAQETAAPLAAQRPLEVGVIDDVAEFDQHSSVYIPIEELKASNDPRWREILDGGWDADESQDVFAKRTIDAIESTIASHRGERVAIVCHGGVINAYLTSLLGLDRGFFYPNYTSIHRVAASSTGDRSVITINETSHLRNTGLPMGLFQQG
jgi:probable phosphoglycerate mutase